MLVLLNYVRKTNMIAYTTFLILTNYVDEYLSTV